MNFKILFIALLFSNFHQIYFYCADKRSDNQQLQLFFPSPKLKTGNLSKKKLSLLEDQRLQLLGETVYKIKPNKEAEKLYIMALESEINEKFDQADRFAIQGYREALKAQPYGKLLGQQDSLAFHLWNLLNNCSLEEDVIFVIKKALWQETQRNIDLLENITLQDIGLLNQIKNAYDLYFNEQAELPSPEEEMALDRIQNIINNVNRAEQQRLNEIEQKRLQRLEQERLQRLEQERLIQQEQVRRQRLENFKKRLIDGIMNYKGDKSPEEGAYYNISLHNCFQFLPGSIVSLKNIGHNKIFDIVENFLKINYRRLNDDHNVSGRIDTKILGEHFVSKGFLRLSAVPEILVFSKNYPQSYISNYNYNIFVLSGTAQDGAYMQCVLFPELDLLFYEIEEHSDGKTLKEQSDSKQPSLSLGAAAAASSSLPPPLPQWKIPRQFR